MFRGGRKIPGLYSQDTGYSLDSLIRRDCICYMETDAARAEILGDDNLSQDEKNDLLASIILNQDWLQHLTPGSVVGLLQALERRQRQGEAAFVNARTARLQCN